MACVCACVVGCRLCCLSATQVTEYNREPTGLAEAEPAAESTRLKGPIAYNSSTEAASSEIKINTVRSRDQRSGSRSFLLGRFHSNTGAPGPCGTGLDTPSLDLSFPYLAKRIFLSNAVEMRPLLSCLGLLSCIRSLQSFSRINARGPLVSSTTFHTHSCTYLISNLRTKIGDPMRCPTNQCNAPIQIQIFRAPHGGRSRPRRQTPPGAAPWGCTAGCPPGWRGGRAGAIYSGVVPVVCRIRF